MDISAIEQAIKDYILTEFLPGEDPNALSDSTPLVTSGVLDSMATLKMVSFLEDTYGVTFEAHELDVEHLDTIATVAALVREKKGA